MKKTLFTLLKIAVSLGILAYIFLKVVDINLLWKELIKANPLYFVAAVAVYFLVQGLSAWRWYVLLRATRTSGASPGGTSHRSDPGGATSGPT